jgi:hypothetical protein
MKQVKELAATGDSPKPVKTGGQKPPAAEK